ncbi:MAG: YigZ family protein [Firmicutes bacterium]|nr:YigZ family protein [Bacillota bacterium]
MDYRYLTLGKRARAEQIMERSKFIATVCPVETREEAEAFFSEIRAEFKDATHNVPAMVIGDKMQVQWASDDGEPQGTSGAPIVQLIVNKGITNAAVMITRYFGGIKLGTGGLVRAYTSSAELGIEEAGIVAAVPFKVFDVAVDYGIYNKIITYRFPDSFKGNMIIADAEFGEKVSFVLSVTEEMEEDVKGILTEISGGNIAFLEGENTIKFVPHETAK